MEFTISEKFNIIDALKRENIRLKTQISLIESQDVIQDYKYDISENESIIKKIEDSMEYKKGDWLEKKINLFDIDYGCGEDEDILNP